jgi:CheY-like chemotaxis protein
MRGAKPFEAPGQATGSAGDDEAEGSMAKLRVGPSVKPGRSGRVLVVDDEVAVGRTIQRLLGDRHDVVALASGSEAIELLRSGADFDVILCDMSMPEVTGIDVYVRATEIRAELADRFVFMTGGSFAASTRDFLERSTHKKIDKPFDLAALRALVRDRVEQLAEQTR